MKPLGHRQKALLKQLLKGCKIMAFRELNEFKQTCTLIKGGDDLQPVPNALLRSIIRRKLLHGSMVHSTTQPDTESYLYRIPADKAETVRTLLEN
jgi:hypothetical protein